jgi:protein TonB
VQNPSRRPRNPFIRLSRRRRILLFYAILGSLILHLAFLVPVLVPGNLFAAKAPPPETIPVEIVTLPPKPAEEAKVEPPPPPAPQPEPQQPPPPPPPKVELPPPTPPPPVTPQQIVVATREVATPPQGDNKQTAAPEKQEPQERPMPPPKPEVKPEPPKPEPPKAEPPPEREITSAIALNKPRARPRDQITDAEHKLPPVVVRPQPPGRAGNSLMPSYPSAARANGLQGRVILLVTLSEQGRPRRIEIARSSGHDQLDESAVRAVWLWRFYRTDSGPPMEATIEIPLDFRL